MLLLLLGNAFDLHSPDPTRATNGQGTRLDSRLKDELGSYQQFKIRVKMKEMISKCIETVNGRKAILLSLVIHLHCYKRRNKDQQLWFRPVP